MPYTAARQRYTPAMASAAGISHQKAARPMSWTAVARAWRFVSATKTTTPDALSRRRALRGILLYRAGLAPVLVFSGSAAEIEGRAEMAQRLGVPAAAVLRAPGSHTTRDEAVLLRELLGGTGAGRILLVTGEQHMIRARRVFERAGFEPLPVVAGGSAHGDMSPRARLELIRDICQEVVARLYYRAAGYL